MPDPQAISTAPAPGPTGAGVIASGPRKRKYSILTTWDKFVLVLMVGIPFVLVLIFIWGPTVASILLSFTNWQGIGPITAKNVVGIQNYVFLFTQYTLFWPALIHNLMWLGFFVFIASPIGIFFAVLLDREVRGSRIYQNIFYFPVVLSLAVVGFIWELQYAPDGFIDSAFGLTKQSNAIDWLGNPSLNIWAVLVAASWRHIGYIMVLYLAGLKGVDPSLREAAAVDGATASQTFFRVVFPAMKPINIVVVVITVIEALRAFDIVYIINRGTNGLELIGALVVQNLVGEGQVIGIGSALAVMLLVVSLIPITIYLSRVFGSED